MKGRSVLAGRAAKGPPGPDYPPKGCALLLGVAAAALLGLLGLLALGAGLAESPTSHLIGPALVLGVPGVAFAVGAARIARRHGLW